MLFTKDHPCPWGCGFCSATFKPSRSKYKWSTLASHTQAATHYGATPVSVAASHWAAW